MSQSEGNEDNRWARKKAMRTTDRPETRQRPTHGVKREKNTSCIDRNNRCCDGSVTKVHLSICKRQ